MGKYHEVYLALSNGIDPPENEWIQFLSHCETEFILKFKRFNRPDLAQNHHFIAEMVQNLMEQVWLCLKKENFNFKISTFKNYVDGIILNMVRQFFRDGPKNIDSPLSEDLDTLLYNYEGSDLGTNPEKTVLQNERIQELETFVKGSLSTHEYNVLRCRYLLELSTGETATRLGKTKEQISRTKTKALNKVKEVWNNSKSKV